MLKREELLSKILQPFNSRQRRSGASLPSVLIGVGIMGIVAAGMGQVYKTSFRAQKRVENNQERSRIADSLVQRVDCKKTFAGVTPGTCPGGVNGVIALKDASNNTFVNGSGNASKIGDWAIKATCNSSAGEVSINIAASKSNIPLSTASGSSLFLKDPLNEQLLDWSHSKSSLFLAGTGLCRSHFSAGSGLCDASTEGNTRYNSASKQLEFCNGTTWVTPGGFRSECPSGYTLIGTPGTANAYCISTQKRQKTTFGEATRLCSLDGYHLCSASEWSGACWSGLVPELIPLLSGNRSGLTGGPANYTYREWASDILEGATAPNVPSPSNYGLGIVMGYNFGPTGTNANCHYPFKQEFIDLVQYYASYRCCFH